MNIRSYDNPGEVCAYVTLTNGLEIELQDSNNKGEFCIRIGTKDNKDIVHVFGTDKSLSQKKMLLTSLGGLETIKW